MDKVFICGLALLAVAGMASLVFPLSVGQSKLVYFLTGESFTNVTFSSGGNTYELAVASGWRHEKNPEVLMAFKNDRIITNRSEIYSLLIDYYSISEDILAQDLQNLKQTALDMNSTRKRSEERLCMQYTGSLDFNGSRLWCKSEEECIANCRRVEICDRLSFGIGKPFIREIMDFQNDVDNMDRLNTEFPEEINKPLSTLSSHSTSNRPVLFDTTLAGQLKNVSEKSYEFQSALDKFSNSPLSNMYYFCPNMGLSPAESANLYAQTDKINDDVRAIGSLKSNLIRLYITADIVYPWMLGGG